LDIVTRWSSKTGAIELAKLGIDAKHLCEKSAQCVVQAAPVTARLVDWFLGEVAS
jgi:hypothetical protein